jgi:hypothetical protein
MPNGGSDCCGTCWFNSKNNGEKGFFDSKKPVVVCLIRNLEIRNPFWTYCANHPQHNEKKIDLPLGPVYISDGYPYSRKIFVNPPDNEEIRLKLLELLENISNELEFKYPSDTDFEEEIIKQLTSLKEIRAVEGLKRIINLDIEAYRNQINFITRNKAIIVGQAIEALLEITDGETIEDVQNYIHYGLEEITLNNYDQKNDNFAAIRYHLVRGLKHSKSEEAKELLMIALNDPHEEVRAFAEEILNDKLGS